MRILIVDDHQLFIDGLLLLLNTIELNPRLTTANTSTQALEKLTQHNDWDIVLLDLIMPGIDGIGLLQRLQAEKIPYPVIVISSEIDASKIQQALNFGAMGFIPKSSSQEVMLKGIKEVLSGELFLPEDVQDALAHLPQISKLSSNTTLLSTRQLSVLHQLAKGYSNQQMAEILFISESTVKTHLNAIFKILQVKNRVSCLQRAEELELVVRA